MKRNKIIQGTLMISRFSFWAFIVILVLFAFAFIHAIISPETYSNFQIVHDGNPLTFDFKYCKDCISTTNGILLSEISQPIKIWILLRYSILLVLLVLIQYEGIKIWKSVKEFKTFHRLNRMHLRQIAKYAFGIALLGIFNFIDEGQNGIGLEIGIPVVWGAVALFSLGLSEVFQEGHLLQVENNSIV